MVPTGLCAHTSGRGIVERARKKGVAPIELALKWYRGLRRSGVHFCIDHDGTLYQMLDANIRGAHVGISRKERKAYLDGSWAAEVPVTALCNWMMQWPEDDSPQHLYPTKSPNGCLIGVEMIPLAKAVDGLWFTLEQHQAVLDLYRQLAVMYQWPLETRSLPNKHLLGHEDIDAFARWQMAGGWDPGALRRNPRFRWGLLERK